MTYANATEADEETVKSDQDEEIESERTMNNDQRKSVWKKL